MLVLDSLMTADAMVALGKVVMIDLVLAGDNAIVIGMAAAGLPKDMRNKAILVGIIAATVLRIAFATVAVQMLQVLGLLLVGGILLFWVCWKMWRELRNGNNNDALESLDDADLNADGSVAKNAPQKTFAQAAWQIVIADISMSLDNVLAVAGAARDHPTVLIIGLILSIALMGLAATFIAKLLNKHHWIAYVGLAIIVYVAGDMVYRGAMELWPLMRS